MSKKNLKDLIKIQAEESVDRIQDGYNWRNGLFKAETSDVVLNNLNVEQNTPVDVNETSYGVISTPYDFNKYHNPLPSDNAAENTELIDKPNLTSDGVLLTPEGVSIPSFDVNITPYHTPISSINLAPENIRSNHHDVLSTSDGVKDTPRDTSIPRQTLTSNGVIGTPDVVMLTSNDVNNTSEDTSAPKLESLELASSNGVKKQQDVVNKTPYVVTETSPNSKQALITDTIFDSNLTSHDLIRTPNDDLSTNINPKKLKKSEADANKISKKKTQKKPLLGQTDDLYLIGLWFVLKTIFKNGYGNYTLRELAKRLQVDHSNLLRSLNRAESAGLIRRVSTNDGTYIEIMTDLLLFPGEQQEGTLQSFISRFNNPNFQKEFQVKENLFAIFWSILAAHKQPEELSGSTFEILITLALKHDGYYAAAFIYKYLPRVKSNPATFFKTILDKENDPLSKAEIEYGNEIITAAKNLTNANPESLGLATMRTMGKRFFLDLGGSLEECKQILQDVKNRYDNLVNSFISPK
ncbi:MAG: hypothetical protein LBF82_01515 [Lactobacillales bacterium]|jgi:hypothetical protein|nr:hypothetical protein [Lactobacillales bacterium]